MIDDIRVIEMAEQLNLHLVKSNKFKTDLIGVFVKRPLNEMEATYNTLLTRILEQGTKSWSDIKSLNDKLDNMYGAILSCDVNKYGETHAMQFKIQMPNGKHVRTSGLLDEGIEIINEIVNMPYIENGLFDQSIFNNEVKNLKEEIQSRVNDKMIYAMERCTELMCENEPFKYHQYGTLEMLESITPESLMAHYKHVVKTSVVDIVVIGAIDFDYTAQVIRDRFTMSRGNMVEIPETKIHFEVEEIRHLTEHFDVAQAKLTLGFRTNIEYNHPLYNASVIYSNILGGGASSRLFKNVREKESLCYYIFSTVEKFKGLMLISSGIEAKDKQIVMEMIEREMTKLSNGEFDDNDIRISKDALTSAIRSISDYPNSFMNFYYSQKLGDRPFDLENMLERIEMVSKEEIMEAGRMMALDTLYFLAKEGA